MPVTVGASLAPIPPGIAFLTGKVKLVSDHGAGIVSNNGGAVIANNGAGVVANNGAGFRLQAQAAESLLAEAEIAFVDAAGLPIRGADGQPVTARTDREGRYELRPAPPAGNMVLKVKLWNGGELSAILAGGAADRAATLDVDTASSLGAAFVLGRLVKGDQALLDKLPAAEAIRLTRELEASRELLAASPTYDAAQLAAAADELRSKAPAVDEALKTIEALLLGQKKLGDGQLATRVPLNRPYGVAAAPDGTLTIAESGLGRLRRVSPDGLMITYADAGRGLVKKNFIGVRDLLRLPDGTLIVPSLGDRTVWRIKPDDSLEKIYAADFAPWTVARAPDGTLYVGGKGEHPDNKLRAPRWAAVAPDGTAREMPLVGPGGNGTVASIVVAPQGGLYMLRVIDRDAGSALYHIPPAGEPTVVTDGLELGEDADMTIGPDGMLYVSETGTERVLAIARDGTKSEVVGPAAPAGAPKIVEPTALSMGPDGTLYVSDTATARIYARGPAGVWRAVAGIDSDAPLPDGNALPLNSPSALAFDGQGQLLIAENGRHRVVRYAGGRLETVAGFAQGFGGDGGPALQARFSGLAGMATRGDEIYLLDAVNGRLRRVGADGIVQTIAGAESTTNAEDLASYPAADLSLRSVIGLALAPDGRPYWTSASRQQVLRLGAPDRIDVVMGKLATVQPAFADVLAHALPEGQPAREALLHTPTDLIFDPKADPPVLFVADAVHFQIRKITGLETDTPKVEAFVGRGPATFTTLLGSPDTVARDAHRLEADLVVPGGLCFDPQGNMYIGEMGTRRLDVLSELSGAGFDLSGLPAIPPRIRKVAVDGQVTTIAGPGGKFFTDPDAEDALVMPTAIAFAPDGRLIIADPGANLVRILPAGSF